MVSVIAKIGSMENSANLVWRKIGVKIEDICNCLGLEKFLQKRL
jgi:hypothetical protein